MLDVYLDNWQKLLYWFCYNVVLSLLSIPLVKAGAWITDKKKRLFEILKDGQLCFYSTTSVATFIHDAVPKGISPGTLIVCIFILLLSAFIYGVAAVHSDAANESSQKKIGWASIGSAITATILIMDARLGNGTL